MLTTTMNRTVDTTARHMAVDTFLKQHSYTQNGTGLVIGHDPYLEKLSHIEHCLVFVQHNCVQMFLNKTKGTKGYSISLFLRTTKFDAI